MIAIFNVIKQLITNEGIRRKYYWTNKNSPFNKELQLKKKALLKEKTELNKKLEKIEQDLKNL